MAAQKSYSLGNVDLQKLGKGLLIAVAGAALTFLAAQLPHLDLGKYAYVLYPLLSLLVNAGLKIVDGKSQ